MNEPVEPSTPKPRSNGPVASVACGAVALAVQLLPRTKVFIPAELYLLVPVLVFVIPCIGAIMGARRWRDGPIAATIGIALCFAALTVSLNGVAHFLGNPSMR